ncbi:hypothetical protein BB561_002819 [Smittium simulii]|uniref:Uncharacterized protein n=1 Tax=Smittium simulii TaxID=133385 RepID=A0A2T9YP13_9FUNG|nr:hypothetical protein BB561_002819 [Smittium simulii]
MDQQPTQNIKIGIKRSQKPPPNRKSTFDSAQAAAPPQLKPNSTFEYASTFIDDVEPKKKKVSSNTTFSFNPTMNLNKIATETTQKNHKELQKNEPVNSPVIQIDNNLIPATPVPNPKAPVYTFSSSAMKGLNNYFQNEGQKAKTKISSLTDIQEISEKSSSQQNSVSNIEPAFDGQNIPTIAYENSSKNVSITPNENSSKNVSNTSNENSPKNSSITPNEFSNKHSISDINTTQQNQIKSQTSDTSTGLNYDSELSDVYNEAFILDEEDEAKLQNVNGTQQNDFNKLGQVMLNSIRKNRILRNTPQKHSNLDSSQKLDPSSIPKFNLSKLSIGELSQSETESPTGFKEHNQIEAISRTSTLALENFNFSLDNMEEISNMADNNFIELDSKSQNKPLQQNRITPNNKQTLYFDDSFDINYNKSINNLSIDTDSTENQVNSLIYNSISSTHQNSATNYNRLQNEISQLRSEVSLVKDILLDIQQFLANSKISGHSENLLVGKNNTENCNINQLESKKNISKGKKYISDIDNSSKNTIDNSRNDSNKGIIKKHHNSEPNINIPTIDKDVAFVILMLAIEFIFFSDNQAFYF